MPVLSSPSHGPIELRVESVGQLFHTLDPQPFRERDLDADVEEYVVGWAGEIAPRHPIEINIHLPASQQGGLSGEDVEAAVRRYFDDRARFVGWEMRDLFRTGRASLGIGLLVLASCVALGQTVGNNLDAGYLGRFFDEGLIILGWVANWRPVDIFLYGWQPLVRRRNLYRRLAVAPVRLMWDG